MKNNIFIHKNYSHSKIYLKYVIALFPLLIYGFYKNGILLYFDNSISFVNMFKPIFLPLIGALSGLVVKYILSKKVEFSNLMFYGLLIGMIMPISTNIFIFLISLISLLFLSYFIKKRISFNSVAFIKLILILILLIFNNYEYASAIDLAKDYAFSFIDIIFGRGLGGISSSSIILILIGLGFLLADYYYKKEIPLYAIISYEIVILISAIFLKDFNNFLVNMLSSSALFAFVFIAPISEFSSYTKYGKMIFGILIGVLSAVLTLFIGHIEAALVAILIVSIFKDLIDKFLRQKTTI